MAYVEIGLIYDMSEPESPVLLDGWHVDSLEPLVGAEVFLVLPSTPQHAFAGVPDSLVYRYKFDSKAHAEQFLPVEEKWQQF